MTRPTDAPPKVYGYRDLMKVCGLGRETVKAAIRTGSLPGYVVGRSYVVPADAFDDFLHGRWEPKPRPLFAEPIKPVKVELTHIHQRSKAS